LAIFVAIRRGRGSSLLRNLVQEAEGLAQKGRHRQPTIGGLAMFMAIRRALSLLNTTTDPSKAMAAWCHWECLHFKYYRLV
jgi:hypothetical protein